MNGFTDSWLALREPADERARDVQLVQAVRQFYGDRQSLRVMDLGAGTGSNFRFMAPLLGHNQHWLLVDHDPTLLEQVVIRMQAWAQINEVVLGRIEGGVELRSETFSARIGCQSLDLASQMQALRFDQTDLVTGAALLDLVSAPWLCELAGYCHRYQCAALFALTFDGSIQWSDRLPLDHQVRVWLNRHQRQEKSFGLALGSSAVGAFHRGFGASGFRLQQRYTPWTIGADQSDLHRTLISGWAQALQESSMALTAKQSAQVDSWLVQRLALTDAGATRLIVGHADQLALPRV